MRIEILRFLLLSCLLVNLAIAAPKEFDTADMEKEISWKEKPFTQVAILKWKVEEGGRPLYTESALVVAKHEGKWALAHVYRHPKRTDKPIKWKLYLVFDVPHKPFELFDSLPSEEDLKTFERDTWWTDNARDGFKLIKSGVEEKNIEKFIRKS